MEELNKNGSSVLFSAATAQKDVKQEYTFTVYTENRIGILSRIAIIFSKRKINIESLNTSPSEIDGIHRFNIVIQETGEVVQSLPGRLKSRLKF